VTLSRGAARRAAPRVHSFDQRTDETGGDRQTCPVGRRRPNAASAPPTMQLRANMISAKVPAEPVKGKSVPDVEGVTDVVVVGATVAAACTVVGVAVLARARATIGATRAPRQSVFRSPRRNGSSLELSPRRCPLVRWLSKVRHSSGYRKASSSGVALPRASATHLIEPRLPCASVGTQSAQRR
jgi:hypothetical protein